MKLRAAYTGSPTTARIYWKRLGDDHFDRERSVPLELDGDGKVRDAVVDLGKSPVYRGLITALAIEPGQQPRPGETLTLHAVELVPAPVRN
jgi:hypothetical protein